MPHNKTDQHMPNTLTANGHRFTYIEQGNGPPLVFVHGSLLDYRYWQSEVAHFSRKFRTIAPSRRHHWPAVPDADFSYTADAQTKDVIAFIEALNAGPVHLVGHSYGGYIAAQIACSRPDLLHSLILVEPGGPVEGQNPGISRIKDHKRGATLVQNGDIAQGVAQFLDTVCGTPKWQDGDAFYQSMTLDNAQTITEQVLDTRATLPAQDVAHIPCPVLLMIGARSISPFPETIERLAALLPQATLVRIPNASHMVNMDNPADFLAALDTFLSNVATPAPR